MDTTIVAKLVAVNSDDTILLLRRSASDKRRPLEWDIPGGHTDGDEFANEAAAREALEESGIQVDARTLRLVYTDQAFVADKNLNVVWLFFIGTTESKEVVLSNEHDEYRWVSLDEAIGLIEYDRQKQMLEYVREHHLLRSQA
jgi:8-oxo-dGTP pyrophosphatase MutT (NUDIX family)